MAFAGAVLFSTKAIFIKLAFAHTAIDPVSLLTLRMLFALPVYVGVAIWAGRRHPGSLTHRQKLSILFLGILGYYLSSLFDFLGLQYISAGLERLILFLYPTFAVLINKWRYRQTITPWQRNALLLTYLGIGLAFVSELYVQEATHDVLWGGFLVFLCAITFSGYIVGTGRLVMQVSSGLFTSYAMLAATGGIFVHFALQGNYTALTPDAQVWGYGFLLAMVATVVPSFLMSAGMQRIGSNNAAIIMAIGPVATILQAWWWLNEALTPLQLLGTGLVIAGVWLIGKKQAGKK